MLPRRHHKVDMQPTNPRPPIATDSTTTTADIGAAGTLMLPASLDMTAADALHRALRDRCAGQRPLVIDGADVERISTPCLQLLVAAAVSAHAHGLQFRFAGSSRALHDAARDLGLSVALGLEIAA
jgi:anti-anti-sigma regulatory factor